MQGPFATQVANEEEKYHSVYDEHKVENETALQQSCSLAVGSSDPFPAPCLLPRGRLAKITQLLVRHRKVSVISTHASYP